MVYVPVLLAVVDVVEVPPLPQPASPKASAEAATSSNDAGRTRRRRKKKPVKPAESTTSPAGLGHDCWGDVVCAVVNGDELLCAAASRMEVDVQPVLVVWIDMVEATVPFAASVPLGMV
jgi:hypothetical protein